MTRLNPTQQYFTVSEVAAMFNVHVHSVYRWVRHRRLASYHVGSSVRISPAQLDEFVQPRRRRKARRAQAVAE